MASSSFRIRCKSPKGEYAVIELDSHDSTMRALKESIMKFTGVQPSKMKLLVGYPPRAVKVQNENTSVKDAGIASGDSVIVQVDVTLGDHVVPEICESTTPKKPNQEELVLKESNGHSIDNSKPGIMMRHDVPSDNSCLFSSVYFIVNNGELSKSNRLRKVIAEAVLRDSVKYSAAILGRENQDYCSWILNKDSWGGAIELAILSEHFKMEICAIDIMSCKMLRFGENNNYPKRGIVVYDGIHYDPLYLQYGDKKQTIFDIADVKVLDLALELAREARSSKQFTDIHHFKLKCNICEEHLIGEKDATAHASATGHIDFGELQ